MQAKDKTKSQLIAEMAELQQRHAALEAVDTRRQQAEALLVEQAHLVALGAEVASILTERAALQDMLQRCADLMVRRLNAVLARIWTLSEADGVLVLQASAGLYTHTNGAHSRVPIGTFKIGRIAQNRQPHLTNSVAADPYISDPEWARREGILAFAGHPLIIDDRVVGVMALFAREPLTEGVLVALAAIADRIALGIERKRAEEALRNNEQIFRTLFEHSPDGILVIDPCSPDGPWTIVDCNDVACRMNGYTREELIGQSIDLLNANPSEVEGAVYLDRVRWEGMLRGETTHRRKDGTLFPIEYSTSFITIDGRELLLGIDRDITERKQIEKRLWESEARYRNLVETSPDAITLTDLDANLILCNQQAALLYGCDTVDELIGQNAFAFIAPEDQQYAIDNLQKTLELGRIKNIEYTLLKKDGTRYRVELSASLIVDAEGKPAAFMGVIRDITARKRIEAMLQREQAFLRTLLENLAEGVVACDHHGVLTLFNHAARSLHGKDVLPLSADRWVQHYDLYLPDGKTPMPTEDIPLIRALNGEQVRNVEMMIVPKPGVAHTLLASGNALFDTDGQKLGAVVVMHDITERKQAEQTIRESAARTQAILEVALDCIITIDHEGRIIEFNPAAERTFGYRWSEVVGRELAEVIVPPSLREKHRQGLARYVTTGESLLIGRRIELTGIRSDGAEFPLELAITHIPSNGMPTFTGHLRDITERKAAEEALQQAKEELERRVQTRTAELARTNEELRAEIVERWRVETALRESEELLRKLLENFPNGSVNVFDKDLRYILAEGKGLQQVGLSSDQLVGKTLDELFPREMVDVVRPYYRKAFAGVAVEFELALDSHYYSINAAPLRDRNGDSYAIIAVAQNITERKRAEQALRKSEQEYHNLFELANDAILIFDPEGEIVLDVNHRACDLYGIPRERFLGTSLKDFSQDPQRGEQYLRTVLAEGAFQGFESVQYRADGTPIDLLINASLVEFQGRQAILSINRDITERKRAAQARELAIVEEREWIAREMHDSVAQVLGYVNIKAEAAQELLGRGQADRAAAQIEQLAEAARSAYTDVREDILALRSSTGRKRRLSDTLRDYLEHWQDLSGVPVELLPSDTFTFQLSPTAELQLVRIIQEALTNVRKHAHAERATVRFSDTAGGVEVVVEDDGGGFDPKALQRGPFPRFGLATMRERAEACGGALEIDSAPGRGTRVKVYLPTAPNNRCY